MKNKLCYHIEIIVEYDVSINRRTVFPPPSLPMHELELSVFEVFDVFVARAHRIPTYIPAYIVSVAETQEIRVTRDKGRDFSRAGCAETSSSPPPLRFRIPANGGQ